MNNFQSRAFFLNLHVLPCSSPYYHLTIMMDYTFPGNAVIPKSVKPFRIEENLAVFRFSLDAEDMVALNGIRDKFEPFGYRTANVLHYKKHPQYPFREELAKL